MAQALIALVLGRVLVEEVANSALFPRRVIKAPQRERWRRRRRLTGATERIRPPTARALHRRLARPLHELLHFLRLMSEYRVLPISGAWAAVDQTIPASWKRLVALSMGNLALCPSRNQGTGGRVLLLCLGSYLDLSLPTQMAACAWFTPIDHLCRSGLLGWYKRTAGTLSGWSVRLGMLTR